MFDFSMSLVKTEAETMIVLLEGADFEYVKGSLFWTFT